MYYSDVWKGLLLASDVSAGARVAVIVVVMSVVIRMVMCVVDDVVVAVDKVHVAKQYGYSGIKRGQRQKLAGVEGGKCF